MNRAALEMLRDKWRSDWPHRDGMDLFHDGLALLDALLEPGDPEVRAYGPLESVQPVHRPDAPIRMGPPHLARLEQLAAEYFQRWGADGADTAWRASLENEPYRAWEARRLVENWSA